MKSLLVDALRQAKEGEASGTLSDSGSFDATRDDFGVTANDEDPKTEAGLDANHPENGDLQLLETCESADTDLASNDAVEFMPEELATTEADTRIAITASLTAVEDAPRLAKYSPLLCLCLLLVAAGLWAAYLNINGAHSATALGAVFSASRQSETAEDSRQGLTEERFPFLSPAEPSTVDEVSE